MTTVGIDFGTTNSVVAAWTGSPVVLPIDTPPGEWADLGFESLMPSVFARTDDGSATFGWTAKRARRNRFEAVKRLFATQQEHISDDAGDAFAVEEIATMLFAEFKRAAAEHGNIDATRAVVTVPANSRGLARQRTKICAGMGGFEVLALLNEPTAAAMSYALRSPGDQQLLVFDWGGGTLDVTVLRSVAGVFIEQASKGLPTSGGIDFDSRLSRAIIDRIPDSSTWSDVERHEFRTAVELAKIKLSTQETTNLQLPGGVVHQVTRSTFEDAVRPLIEASRAPIEQCLRDIGAGAAAIDAVVMVGGTSQIPAVRQFVADVVGQPPAATVNPLTAVGEGAAVAAAILTGELETNDFFVSTEHALGTVISDGRHERFSVVIPRNHKLPAERTEQYSPLFPEQESVYVQVIEGDPDRPLDDPDTVELQGWSVPLPGEPGTLDRGFSLTYHYDVSGILRVRAVDDASGVEMLHEAISFGASADKRELVRMAERARAVVQTGTVERDSAPPKLDADAISLLQKAHVQVIPFLDASDADLVREAVERLESAEPGAQEAAKESLRRVLAPYSYLF